MGPGPEPLWGIGQIAAYLGRGKETVRGWWQATRARAADATAAAAADALPIPAFLSPGDPDGIHGFFTPAEPDAAAARTPWWETPRARPLWRPQVIAAWALTTGRTTADGMSGWERRLPVPMFADLPALPAALPRVVDEVVQLPPRWAHDGRIVTAHLRIWEGPLSPAPSAARWTPPRTVVLLSPADAPLPLTGVDDLADRILAAGHLTERQARRALWFLQGEQIPQRQPDGAVALRPVMHYLSFALQPTAGDEPADVGEGPVDDPALPPQPARHDHRMAAALKRRLDGAPAGGPLRAPQLLPAALEHIDHLVGEVVEVYPHGTCTTTTVARHASGERPVQMDWDTVGLADDLAHLPDLATAATADGAGGGTADAADLQAHRAAVCRTAAHWVAAHADLAQYRLLGLPGLGRDAVLRRVPEAAPELDGLVEATLADQEQQPYSIAVLLRDLTAVRHVLASLDQPGGQPGRANGDAYDPGPQGALVAALLHAAARIGQQYHQVTAHVAEHRSMPVRLPDSTASAHSPDAGGSEPATYLDTVSWWGPTPEDRADARLLAGMFFEHERAAGLRHGYDPFGRLVLHCAQARAFAVQWPSTAAPAVEQPITPTYQPLPDGRVDLLPLDA
ncbi:hypothetical protein [Actinomadura coerulea]|uniref:hypothetical protein n=1 Tax=Actinomadura coerulea TaxID=46159 RepID=UPI003427D7DC